MGTITVTIADDAERWLRKTAGQGKGKLGGMLTKLVEEKAAAEKQEGAAEWLLERMRKAKPIGLMPVSREELHERTCSS